VRTLLARTFWSAPKTAKRHLSNYILVGRRRHAQLRSYHFQTHTTFEFVKIESRLPSAESEEKSPTHAHFFACNKGIFNFIDVMTLRSKDITPEWVRLARIQSASLLLIAGGCEHIEQLQLSRDN
jgi:hypothetical protein